MLYSNSKRDKYKKFQKILIIISLVIASEMIFSLPFHVIRYFRITLLDVFQTSNAKLGDAFAIYGIIAMISYFPSGIIADKFSARKLMSIWIFDNRSST